MILITCVVCGKERLTERKEAKYCSKKCSAIGRTGVKLKRIKPKKGKVINCLICGKQKYYYPSALKKGGGKYCSNECMTKSLRGISRGKPTEEHRKKISQNHHCVAGDKNPNYKGGIAKRRTKWQNKNWKKALEWRNTILDRDDNKCKICGSKDRLEVHHIIPVAESYMTALLPMNGITLCHGCHKQTDNYGGGARFEKKIEDGIGNTICLMHTIPHKFQSYDTLGNWSHTDDGLLVIFVSDIGDQQKEKLIYLHEFVEANLCHLRGITTKMVDNFDLAWKGEGEPGDDPEAPYFKEHQFASIIERLMAHELGVDWQSYNKRLEEIVP